MATFQQNLDAILEAPIRPRRGLEPKEQMQQFRRMVSRSPEVMVKVTGGSGSVAKLNAHVHYITRHWQLDAENERDEKLGSRDELKADTTLWSLEDAARPQRKNAGRIALHVILSMPAGTPPEPLYKAARDFCAEEFRNHQYLTVLHTDQANPHVHVVVRMTGLDGTRLHHGKADLQRWRQTFAHRLRWRGIEAEATPRRARGIVKKHPGQALHHLAKRPEKSRVLRNRAMEIAREVLTGAKHDRPWEQATKARQAKIRTAMAELAAQLERTGTPDGQELAQKARKFLKQMPPIETQREEDLKRAAAIVKKRGLER